ncbi:type 4a pilus biogenesis protein PilO [Patescibacteria group bacterium]|nr:type 4a pilus biogenesis protein PilO [Patescibacteria group bacterium]MBU0964344.1 type 4a pilus biogenesis protein PilO [Patescibacteria group bacterium]
MNLSIINKRISLFFNKHFKLLLAFMIAVIIGLGYFLFIQTIIVDIQEIGVVDLEGRKQTLVQKNKILEELDDLEKKYNDVTYQELKRLYNFLPQQSEIPYIILEIQKFVKENELELIDISTGPLGGNVSVSNTIPIDSAADSGSSINRLSITVTVGGIDTYQKIKEFLDNMSVNLPLLELNSFSYSPATSAYSLNITTFYQ